MKIPVEGQGEEESYNPYKIIKNSSKTLESSTPVYSMKSTTMNSPKAVEKP